MRCSLLNKVQLICTNDHLYQGHHAQRRCPRKAMQFFALEKTFCSTCPSMLHLRSQSPRLISLQSDALCNFVAHFYGYLMLWSPPCLFGTDNADLLLSINKGIKCHAFRLWWCRGCNQGIILSHNKTWRQGIRKGVPTQFFSSVHACVALIYAALKLIFNYLPLSLSMLSFTYGIVSKPRKEPFFLVFIM